MIRPIAQSRATKSRATKSRATQSHATRDEEILALRPTALVRAFRSESIAFWCLCFYYMVEYVRPQSIYRWLDVFPWGQTALIATIGTFVLERRKARGTPTILDILLGLFTVWLVVSSLGAQYPGWASAEWTTFANWVIVFFLTTRIVTTPRRMFLCLVLYLLWSLKMSLFGARTFAMRGFAFTTWGMQGPLGWFQNSGELAIQMCIFMAMSIAFVFAIRPNIGRRTFLALLGLLPGTAAMTIIASSSRGGQLAMVGLLLFFVVTTRYRVRALVSAGVVFAGLWLVLPAEQKARFEAIGVDDTSQSRIAYLEDGIAIANDHPITGIGYRNWLPYYQSRYDPTGELPHNIFVEAGAELGYPGLLAFLLLVFGTFFVNARTRRLSARLPVWGRFLRTTALGLDAALVGYLIAGFFVTVLYYPFFWVNLAFTGALYVSTLGFARQTRRLRTAGGRDSPGRFRTTARGRPASLAELPG